MLRRPWLALVVLILVGISAAMFVHAKRAGRTDDEIAIAFDDDVVPCEAPALSEPVRVVVAVVTPALAEARTPETAVLSIAPKTSPPR